MDDEFRLLQDRVRSPAVPLHPELPAFGAGGASGGHRAGASSADHDSSPAVASYASIDGTSGFATTASSGRTRDVHIRAPLRSVLESRHAGTETLIVDEMPIAFGWVKMDVAVMNGRLEGYEIKSDADRLDRLPRQMSRYVGLFDRLTVVTTERHRADVLAATPAWCGVTLASVEAGLMRFDTVREPLDNPEWDVVAVLFLLWQNETYDLARKLGVRGVARETPKGLTHAYMARVLPHDVLRAEVLGRLRARSTWTPKQRGSVQMSQYSSS